jgi:hypothetical protein
MSTGSAVHSGAANAVSLTAPSPGSMSLVTPGNKSQLAGARIIRSD